MSVAGIIYIYIYYTLHYTYIIYLTPHHVASTIFAVTCNPKHSIVKYTQVINQGVKPSSLH